MPNYAAPERSLSSQSAHHGLLQLWTSKIPIDKYQFKLSEGTGARILHKFSQYMMTKMKLQDVYFCTLHWLLGHLLPAQARETPSAIRSDDWFCLCCHLYRSGRSVFFTSCAGTGKSLLLKHVIRALPRDTTFITVFTDFTVPLRYTKNKEQMKEQDVCSSQGKPYASDSVSVAYV